jgi:hypothetical protein
MNTWGIKNYLTILLITSFLLMGSAFAQRSDCLNSQFSSPKLIDLNLIDIEKPINKLADGEQTGWFISVQERNDAPLPIAGILTYLITPKGADYRVNRDYDLGDTHDFEMSLSKKNSKGITQTLAARSALYTQALTPLTKNILEYAGEEIAIHFTERSTLAYTRDSRKTNSKFASGFSVGVSVLNSDIPSKFGAATQQKEFHKVASPDQNASYKYVSDNRKDRVSLFVTPVLIIREDILKNNPGAFKEYAEIKASAHTIGKYSYVAIKMGVRSKLKLNGKRHKLGRIDLGASVESLLHENGVQIKPQIDIGYRKARFAVNTFVEYSLGNNYNDVNYNYRDGSTVSKGMISGLKITTNISSRKKHKISKP